MFTTFIYTYDLATVAQTNFLNHILNRQLVGNCSSNPLNNSIGHVSFSKISMLCSQLSFFTYVEAFFLQINVLYLSPNRQLNRQPATELASGK